MRQALAYQRGPLGLVVSMNVNAVGPAMPFGRCAAGVQFLPSSLHASSIVDWRQRRPKDETETYERVATGRYDYIIVGAGSAGCVLANRLTAAGGLRVLLIEAGGRDGSVVLRMPAAFSLAMQRRRSNWGYVTQPEPGLDGRRLDCPRGKVLGGSSSINGMVYVRGHRRDFDHWEALGAAGWGYGNCLPYFRRAETWQAGADDFRGGDGPLRTTLGNQGDRNPLYGAFVEAGLQAGYPHTDDCNGRCQEGFGAFQMTVDGGARASAARAYLKPVARRANLEVVTDATADRVVLDGKTAVGVTFRRGRRSVTATAKREVILAAGAIGSPALLQRSGIGPACVLQDAGVALQHELPGVGENLQDHLEVYCQYRCRQPITLNGRLNALGKAWIGLRWALGAGGLGATNHFEAGAFVRSSSTVEWPDVQLHFLPAAVRYDGRGALRGHGFQVHVGANKPFSRGSVAIVSARPEDAPRIRFQYLTDERDVRVWRSCIRLTQRIMAQPALAAYRDEELQPGAAVSSAAEIDRWVRNNAESAYHPCGACRMGAAEDDDAVVDPQCRVRGLAGLRVVDSSVFPAITNGNLNAPTIMVAERAADMILGKVLLASDERHP